MLVGRAVLGTLIIAGELTFAGCRRTAPDVTVMNALMCDECMAGQVDSVVAHGARSVPMLLNALALPPRDVVLGARRTAISEWRRVRRGTPPAGLPPDSARSVDTDVERFITAYQRRAAYLLRRIGTPEAKHALEIGATVLPTELPGVLRPTARHLVDSLWRTFP